MTDPEFDVAVVGAGIVGASCAWECARAGLKVALIEAGTPGSATTAANMGELTIENGSDAEFRLTQYSVRLWNELEPELPPQAEFFRVGSISIASTEEELRQIESGQRFFEQHGIATTLYDRETLAKTEPNLRPDLAGGLLTPSDCSIYPPAACRFFVERSRALGARIFSNRPVRALEPKGVRLADNSFVTARNMVNAAGPLSPRLSPGVPVQPRKGQLAITDRYPGWIHHQLIETGYVERAMSDSTESIAFNLQPRRTGQLLIGSSRQLGNAEPAVDPAFLRSMLERACEFAPGLRELSVIRTWTGFRPATPDHLPLIGPWPSQPGVFLATGHDGLGITMALGTGRLLSDQILGRASEIPVTPYLPSRLAGANRGS